MYQHVDWVLSHSRAKGVTHIVLLTIAKHANEDGEAWPSNTTLAKYAKCSVRHIRNATDELVRLGELEKIENGSPVGRADKKANLYRLVMSGCTCRRVNGTIQHRATGAEGGAEPGDGSPSVEGDAA